jgi:hypothetical protein
MKMSRPGSDRVTSDMLRWMYLDRLPIAGGTELGSPNTIHARRAALTRSVGNSSLLL